MKYYVEIPEVHKALVEIEVSEPISRDKLLELAQKEFEDIGSDHLEYSHTLEQEHWVTRTETGDFVT